MKKTNTYSKIIVLLSLAFITTSCEKGLSEDAIFATFPNTAEVFDDAPVGMGTNFYFPYGGSKPTAWTVDEGTSYDGTASMRFDVPDANDAGGNYAGGIFRVDGAGRDLTGYDALTFWAKASQSVMVAEIGFGEDFGANKYKTTRQNVQITTNWQKIIIPIPDASKLVNERGMFRYSAAGVGSVPGQERGYTFWIDELKFEKLGTLAQPQPKILNGVNVSQNTFNGASFQITGTQTYNTASGQNITVIASPSYFRFDSSDSNVAIVNELGNVSVNSAGSSTISASIAGTQASGSLMVTSIGDFALPNAPTLPAGNVISVFSNTYTDVPVDYFNGYWGGSTTQTDNLNINGDDLKQYTQLNYVGIEFQNPTIDATAMTSLHLDLYTQVGGSITIRIRDRGANGTIESDFNGNPTGDDADLTFTTTLTANQWNLVEIPLNGTLASQKNNLSQIVFIGGVTSFIVDNIYFHN